MAQNGSSDESPTFIVQSQAPDVLAEIVALMKSDPKMRLVREIGPPGEPHTLAIAMSEDRAAMLRERFKGRVIVERDRPLSLY